MSKRVVIIGAGASGLTAIKSCLEEGIAPVCLEKELDAGGLWNYTDDATEGKANVYKSCVINTSKEMFSYSDFPVPSDFPPFMPQKYVLRYLRMYADHFNLLRHIRFGVTVEFIKKAPDYDLSGRWEVGYSKQIEAEHVSGVDTFDAVMVCSGHHAQHHLPDVNGMERFQGVKIHSQAYKTPEPFINQKVLVVGIGNSAVDIAVDLSRVASQVYLSTRRGAWVIGRMGPFGIPMDVLANSRSAFILPRSWLQRLVEIMANLRFDHGAMGLSPTHRVLESHPTINDELPLRILTGSVKVKPDIVSMTTTSVVFDDCVEEQIDAVIFATGYDYQCRFISQDVIDLSENKVNLYKYMFPPNLNQGTLAMIGLVQPVGAFPPISEMQSRWFAKLVKGTSKLPDVNTMLRAVKNRSSFLDKNYFKSMKHTCETFWIEYMDEIAVRIGVKPNLFGMMFKDPCLALRCIFGPCVPAQYRLQGPGSWRGAKEAIRRAYTNNSEATRTRKVNNLTTNNRLFSEFMLFLFFLGVMMFLYDVGMFI